MTDAQRVQDWVHLYRVSPLKYEMNCLTSCYRNDGEAVLLKVLKALGLERSVDLVKDAAKK